MNQFLQNKYFNVNITAGKGYMCNWWVFIR